MKKEIVYFGQTPGQGTGSPINMLRHLRRFEAAGWKVTVVVEWGQATTECVECGWSVHRLCLRKKWWPPFCSDIRLLRALRMMLWARECHKTLRSDHPCGILTYLSYHSELMSEVAAYFSVITAIPMTVIVYDDVTAFRKSQALASDAITKRYRSILQSASKVWFVSTELAAAYGFPQVEESVLMPIPGGSVNKVAWRNEFSKRPVLTYAGYLYLQQHSMIGRLAAQIASAGGLLLVVSVSKEELFKLSSEVGIEFCPLFTRNEEVMEYVGSRASAFLGVYCDNIEDMPWTKSSFPSKIVEFSHLGFPILSVASYSTAVFSWNALHRVEVNCGPFSSDVVIEFVNALKQEFSWEVLAAMIRDLSEREFDPASIQNLLEGNFACTPRNAQVNEGLNGYRETKA